MATKSKHGYNRLARIEAELEKVPFISVRRTTNGHLFVRNIHTKLTASIGGEALSGKGNRNTRNTAKNLEKLGLKNFDLML